MSKTIFDEKTPDPLPLDPRQTSKTRRKKDHSGIIGEDLVFEESNSTTLFLAAYLESSFKPLPSAP